MKSKTVPIPIYYGKLTIITTDDFKKVNKIFNTKIKNKLHEAVVFQVLEGGEIVVAIKKVEWSIIAHEAVHVVNEIFLNCGIELDRINDEPQAYLTGWVVSEIDKFLKEQ